MKRTDLMIGDWVYNKHHKKNICITPYDFFTHGHLPSGRQYFIGEPEVISGRDLEPIPLTPEILEKNEFTLKPDGWLWCKEEGIEDTNYIFIQFRKGCEEVRLVELNFVNKVLAKYEQMRYVHQLQHALKLCRIDKEIKL